MDLRSLVGRRVLKWVTRQTATRYVNKDGPESDGRFDQSIANKTVEADA